MRTVSDASGATPKTARTPHRLWVLPLLAAVLLAALAAGGLTAKYVMQHQRENEMIAAGFHISSPALKESSPAPTYSAICGADGNFTIDLYNWEVENTDSISQVDIAYMVTVTNGTLASVKNGGVALTAVDGKYTLPAGTLGNDATKVTHVLAVTPSGSDPVTVTVAAVSPYEKTLSATFTPSSGAIKVTKNDLGGGVTQLIIETNQYEGEMDLVWDAAKYPNPGVNETSYGWRVGYYERKAVITAEKETTYYFEFNSEPLTATGESITSGISYGSELYGPTATITVS